MARQNQDNGLLIHSTGLYISLDFAYLKELSTLDMYLREIILKMTIDIEHFLKVKMLNDLQKNILRICLCGYSSNSSHSEILTDFIPAIIPGIP